MKITHNNPLLGAHMSIAGGPKNALIAGESIGCTAIQIFTASNRQWSFAPVKDADVTGYLEYKKTSSIQSIISHASYLINLGSPEKLTVEKSIKALEAELNRCDQLNIPFLVMHPGAHLDTGVDACLERIAENINTILETTKFSCSILLENTAGQGTNVGYTFEQLATIRKHIHHKKRVGICFDTCHACAAGYNFSTQSSYKKLWDDFDAAIGLENLKAIHMNDSKKAIGSHVDRHEHIGEGAIGLDAFSYIMNDKRFLMIPKILETPKDETLRDDIRNLATLKSLLH